MIGNSKVQTNFPHKLPLTNTQASRLPKTFPNNSLVNIKLSKTQLHRIRQSVGSFRTIT